MEAAAGCVLMLLLLSACDLVAATTTTKSIAKPASRFSVASFSSLLRHQTFAVPTSATAQSVNSLYHQLYT